MQSSRYHKRKHNYSVHKKGGKLRMNTRTNSKGFTIIEVVLVLAIAALIFLMIFIALPALQRGQRDTARKQDANTVATALNTWRGNHRGSLPATDDDKKAFTNEYVKTLGQYDLTGIEFTVNGTGPSFDKSSAADLNKVGIALGAHCNDDGSAAEPSSKRSAAVLVMLEQSKAVICVDA